MAIEITPEDIQAIAPEFASYLASASEDDYAEIIVLARTFVCESKWGETKAKKAICLMTAHLLKDLGFGSSGSTSVSGPVVSERVGDLSRTYAQTSVSGASVSDQLLMTTKYGKTFLMLRRTLVTTPAVV